MLLSSNYALYGDMSRRVNLILAEFSPDVEAYSIDESFVGFAGFAVDGLEAHAQRLRETVRRDTGIPVCVGLAPTRVLAKVANHAAKQQAAYEGVCLLEAECRATRALLETLPVTELWGVARRTAERLHHAQQGQQAGHDEQGGQHSPVRTGLAHDPDRELAQHDQSHDAGCEQH